MKQISRDNQKFIFAIFKLIINDRMFRHPKAKVYDYEKKAIVQEFKMQWIKIKGYKVDYKPLEGIEDRVAEIIAEGFSSTTDKPTFADYITQEVKSLIIDEVKKAFLSVGHISLSQNLMSNEEAVEFTHWLLNYCFEHHVDLGDIKDKLTHDELSSHTWWCIKQRKCVISGRLGADLDHWKTVASIGGYKYCDGLKTPFLPVSRKYHNEIDKIGRQSFMEKYNVVPIMLKYNDVKWLVDNNVYPNQFKAFKDTFEFIEK